jgi:hypothetical protein
MTTTTISYHANRSRAVSLGIPGIPWKLLYVFGIATILMLVVFYVFEIHDLTNGTYQIRQYEKQIGTLNDQNGVLETHFAQAGFLGSVQDKATQLSFVKTTSVQYIQILENSLASANQANIK